MYNFCYRVLDLATLCAEVTAAFKEPILSQDWLGVLKSLCLSAVLAKDMQTSGYAELSRILDV